MGRANLIRYWDYPKKGSRKLEASAGLARVGKPMAVTHPAKETRDDAARIRF
jgi:hypothetical protein